MRGKKKFTKYHLFLLHRNHAAFQILIHEGIESTLSAHKKEGSYVVDGVLMGDKSLISNEEQILKKFTRF